MYWLELPPIALILIAAFIYTVFVVAKKSYKEGLILFYIIIVFSLLFLPGGKRLTNQSQTIASKTTSFKCLGEGIIKGVPWRNKESFSNVDSCLIFKTKNKQQTTPALNKTKELFR